MSLILLAGACVTADPDASELDESSGRGGGGGTVPGPNPLPTTPPAPDVVLRESFGQSTPGFTRPYGDKGRLRWAPSETIQGFWAEYPGDANLRWRAQDQADGSKWSFCSESVNPTALPSPIEAADQNGCLASPWRDGLVAVPTALLPFEGRTSAYSVFVSAWPATQLGSSFSFGLTASPALAGNLRDGGQLHVTLAAELPGPAGRTVHYELRAGGAAGTLLAEGTIPFSAQTPLRLDVDPVAGTVGAQLDGVALGPFSLAFAPHFVALEGQGIVDDLVVRVAE